MFSVIIPTFNEECNISRCIESILSQKEDCEIILADGGSIDGTLLAASLYDIRYITIDKPDISLQINKAAKISKNGILIILHADCVLAPNSLKAIKYFFSKYPMSTGGAFTMRLAGNRLSNRILAMGGDLFCRLFKIYFGDRAMFVKRDVFEKIGGFKVMQIMSDVDFSYQMKKYGKTVLLKGPVLSSSRKFEKEFFLKSLYLMAWSLLAFKRGVSPAIIKKRYYEKYIRES